MIDPARIPGHERDPDTGLWLPVRAGLCSALSGSIAGAAAMQGARRTRAAWHPLSIPGLQYLWDGESTSLGAVSTWTDDVAAVDVDQATGSLQPASTSDSNGFRFLRFASDWLATAGALPTALTQACTVFVIVKDHASGAASRILVDYSGTGARLQLYGTDAAVSIWAGTPVANSSLGWSGARVVTAHYDGSSSYVRADGTTDSPLTTGTAGLGSVTIGAASAGGSPMSIDVYMVGLVQGDISGSDLAKLESFASRYGT